MPWNVHQTSDFQILVVSNYLTNNHDFCSIVGSEVGRQVFEKTWLFSKRAPIGLWELTDCIIYFESTWFMARLNNYYINGMTLFYIQFFPTQTIPRTFHILFWCDVSQKKTWRVFFIWMHFMTHQVPSNQPAIIWAFVPMGPAGRGRQRWVRSTRILWVKISGKEEEIRIGTSTLWKVQV